MSPSLRQQMQENVAKQTTNCKAKQQFQPLIRSSYKTQFNNMLRCKKQQITTIHGCIHENAQHAYFTPKPKPFWKRISLDHRSKFQAHPVITPNVL